MKFLKLIIISLMLVSGTIHAQHSKVTAIVPYAAGGATDLAAKLFAKWIKDKHNIDLVILNKPGAEAVIGSRELSSSNKNGSVIGFHSIPGVAHVRRQNINLTSVSAIRQSASVLVVRSNLDVNDYDDFVTKMRTNSYNVGSTGPAHDVLWKQIYINENIINKPVKINFGGSGQIIISILGGHIDATILPLDVASEHIKSGRLKVLATSFSIPDITATILQDRYSNWIDSSGSVMVLPQNVSSETQAYWVKMIEQYLSDPEVLHNFKLRSTPPLKTGPLQLDKYVNQFEKLMD